MTDADNKNDTSSETDDKSKGNSVNAELAEVREQLRKMNEQTTASLQAIADSMKQQRQRQEPQEEENLYDPNTLIRKAETIFDTRYRAERAKDVTIYNLAQEYPEIQTDSKIRQAVIEAQAQVPASIRDSAEGYEMAVLKAVTKAGLQPKSQRRTVDEDASLGSSGSGTSRQPRKRQKVSAETLAVAELMGIDTSDEKRMKSLEEAANRDTYTKYR